MALVNGSDYDHIDLHSAAGGDVTRHMLKDAQARSDVGELKSALGELIAPLNVISASGASWYPYVITNGHTYKITNSGTSAIAVRSVASSGSDTGIQSLGTVNPGDNVTVQATADAPYLRIYSAAAVSCRIEDLSLRVPVLESKVGALESDVTVLGQYEVINITYPNYGVYYDYQGEERTADNYHSSNLITLPSEPICRFISGNARINGTNIAVACFYDKDNNFIGSYCGDEVEGAHDYAFSNVLIPNNAVYARFSDKVGSAYYCNLFSVVSKDINEIRSVMKLAHIPGKTYYVGYGTDDGDTNFNSLVDCLWVASGNPDRKRILINSGTYDVLDELGGMEHIMEYSSEDGDTAYTDGTQPWVDNCEIIGEGKVILNFKISANTPRANYWLFSCLNVRGNVTIENIEIHSENCRYSIHDESGSNFPNTVRRYKNVRCYQNAEGGEGGQAVGCGFSANTTVYIDDCIFVCNGGPGISAWSCHAKDGCSINMDNTIFDVLLNTSSIGLRVSQDGDAKINAIVSNCYINKGVQIRNETTPAPTIRGKTKISFINTKFESFYCGYTSVGVDEQVISYDTIAHSKTILQDLIP